MDTEFEQRWRKSKDQEPKLLFWNKSNVSDYTTLYYIFSTWRVKLYRNNQKRNKNYFKISGGSRYCSRVRFTESSKCVKKIQVKMIDSGLSYHEVWVGKGSSYWESTVINFFCNKHFQFYIESPPNLQITENSKIWQNLSPRKRHLNNFFSIFNQTKKSLAGQSLFLNGIWSFLSKKAPDCPYYHFKIQTLSQNLSLTSLRHSTGAFFPLVQPLLGGEISFIWIAILGRQVNV